MAGPALKTAIGNYGHVKALKDGTVEPKSFTLDHVEVSPIIAAFRRMIRNNEFDVSEMAISTYLCARAHNKPITAIPIFPLRSFQHGGIVYNTKSGVKEPKDLAGRKVGVRAYTVTGGIWVRGILKDEYGLDPERVTWVIVDEEHVAEYQAPPNVVKTDKDLAEMLVAGEIDAAIGVGRVDSPDVKPLIPDARAAAVAYYQKTGVYPINHTVVVKSPLLESNPSLSVELFAAFKQAKDSYLQRIAGGSGLAPEDEEFVRLRETLGGDPIPYGLAANRKVVEAMIRYNVDQKVIPQAPSVESLFASSTLGLA